MEFDRFYENFMRYKKLYRYLAETREDIDETYLETDRVWNAMMEIPAADLHWKGRDKDMPITDKICPRCGCRLRESMLPHYDFYCVDCEEDFYDFEVKCSEAKREVLPKLESTVCSRLHMCFECESDCCVYNPEGICMFPVVSGRVPNVNDDDGCLDCVPKEVG